MRILDLSRLPYSLSPGERSAAIDIGGTSAQLMVIDHQGESETLPAIPTGERSVEEILQKIEELLAPQTLLRCGVGFPGIVDSNGTIVGSPNLKQWIALHLSVELSKRLQCEVQAGNDANVAALGESLFGSEKQVQELLFLTLGTGVGTGIITSGKILSGKGGFAGEGGHLTVEPNGAPCGCGRKGCLEAHFSERALARIAQEEGYPVGTGAKELFDAAKAGEKRAVELIDRALDHLAIGISGMCALLDPQEIVLGGGISKAGSFLIEQLRPHLGRRIRYPGYSLPTIRLATLGSEAGLLGALAL